MNKYNLKQGDTFRSKHFVGLVTVNKVNMETNELDVTIDPQEENRFSWDETWNLQHTTWGLNSREYFQLKQKDTSELAPDEVYLGVGMQMSVDFNAGRRPDYTPNDVIFEAMKKYASLQNDAKPKTDDSKNLNNDDHEFIVDALNAYWHEANTMLTKRNDLGDIQKRNLEEIKVKAKEILKKLGIF